MMHPLKPGTAKRAAQQNKRQQAHREADLIFRLRQAYEREPDREYAEAVWGELLRNMHVDPVAD